ncbi:MAG: HD domain-containing protein [Candidatus Nanoarchaeia archaeon]|nr:HD domain-containing protein [Candidatus Nanoarchaeia archaeon]
MEEIFEKIWKLALPYQDKRDDIGHAETVLFYALKLIKPEDADEDIVIPAAILHDIGWSQLPKKERLSIFGNKLSKKRIIEVQKKHEKFGVELAKEILKKTNYNKELDDEILEIISGHDTREGFISKNEGIMRDADKLWRFSNKGFWADIKRNKFTPEFLLEKLRVKIDTPNFLYSETAKKIAREELGKRKQENQ